MSWPIDVTAAEIVFQVLHDGIDLPQTLDRKHHPNLIESESLCSGGWLIGQRPRDRAIYAYMGAEAVLHIAVTAALVRWAPAWTAQVWEATTISINGAIVAHNARIGMRVNF
jgi:hypothetical protein